MTRTGVFATAAQIERIKSAQSKPLIMLHLGMPPSPHEVVHVCALEAGLPEIPGYYGCDLASGEFLKV